MSSYLLFFFQAGPCESRFAVSSTQQSQHDNKTRAYRIQPFNSLTYTQLALRAFCFSSRIGNRQAPAAAASFLDRHTVRDNTPSDGPSIRFLSLFFFLLKLDLFSRDIRGGRRCVSIARTAHVVPLSLAGATLASRGSQFGPQHTTQFKHIRRTLFQQLQYTHTRTTAFEPDRQRNVFNRHVRLGFVPALGTASTPSTVINTLSLHKRHCIGLEPERIGSIDRSFFFFSFSLFLFHRNRPF